MNTINLVAITAGLGTPSSSRLLTDALIRETVKHADNTGTAVITEIIELRDYATDIANNMVTGYAAPRLQEVIDKVQASDILIAVTPVFTASMSGLFKSFFDILDNKSLTGKTVIIGATGGSSRHSMVLDFALRPMFNYLRSNVIPTAIYASPEDWGNPALETRISRAAKEALNARTGNPAPIEATRETRSFEEILSDITQ